MGIISRFPVGASPQAAADLAAALTDLGVTLTGDEDMAALVSAVKRIVIGDRRVECFAVAWVGTPFLNQYGYIPVGVPITITRAAFDLQETSRITTLRVAATVAERNALTMTGTGWTVTRSQISGGGETVTAQRALSVSSTRFDIYDALAVLTISSAADAHVSLTVSGVGVRAHAGPALTIRWGRNSWRQIEGLYPTWGNINGTPWSVLENPSAAGNGN